MSFTLAALTVWFTLAVLFAIGWSRLKAAERVPQPWRRKDRRSRLRLIRRGY